VGQGLISAKYDSQILFELSRTKESVWQPNYFNSLTSKTKRKETKTIITMHQVPVDPKILGEQSHGAGSTLHQGGMEIPQSSASEASWTVPEPIAIVGMALRLPGDIKTPEGFWNFLCSKRNARSEFPKSRFNIDGFYSSSPKPGTSGTRFGNFLGEEIDVMDDQFFGIAPEDVQTTDPEQRLLLEIVWECMESGGQVSWQGKDIGFWVGSFGQDWLELNMRETQSVDLGRYDNLQDFSLANRISYCYDLKGPR
jgi:hypothetical protein